MYCHANDMYITTTLLLPVGPPLVVDVLSVDTCSTGVLDTAVVPAITTYYHIPGQFTAQHHYYVIHSSPPSKQLLTCGTCNIQCVTVALNNIVHMCTHILYISCAT